MRLGLFPGQGIPAKIVHDALDPNDRLLAQADDFLGYDLSKRVQIAARRKGAALPTLVAQPAIFVAGIISWRRAQDEGRAWDSFVGHSLGEYTALVAGGSLGFEDGLAAVKVRAETMESASKSAPGGMAAVLGLDFAKVTDIAEQAGVFVANDNAPGQVVLSGPEAGLTEAAQMVRSASARSVLLEVSGPFHSPSMGAASEALRVVLDGIEISTPKVPVISNVTAAAHETPARIRDLLVEQLTHRVRFRESLENLYERGARDFEDLGPGSVVGGLAQRTFRSLRSSEVPANV